jgi:hypothetical protein
MPWPNHLLAAPNSGRMDTSCYHMKLNYFLTLGLASLCTLATDVAAQTKVTQLIIQNANGSTKLSQLPGGLSIDKPLTLTEPGGNTVKLVVPVGGANNYEFLFPTESGTLLTNDATEFNGDAIIAAINEGSAMIDADRVAGGGGGGTVTTNASLLGDGDGTPLGINLANANTWTAAQTFSQTIVGSINGNAANVTGVVLEANGGTGESTYATGDILYASGANNLTKRTIGAPGDVLTVAGGVPTWAAPAGGATSFVGTGSVDIDNTPNNQTRTGTFTVTGAKVGDVVALQIPSTAYTTAGMYFTAEATADDTITVSFNNRNGSPVNPPSITFGAIVMRP